MRNGSWFAGAHEHKPGVNAIEICVQEHADFERSGLMWPPGCRRHDQLTIDELIPRPRTILLNERSNVRSGPLARKRHAHS